VEKRKVVCKQGEFQGVCGYKFPFARQTDLALYFGLVLVELDGNLNNESMKKNVFIIVAAVSIFFISCGGQRNTPSTSSTADSTNMSIDSATTDTGRTE